MTFICILKIAHIKYLCKKPQRLFLNHLAYPAFYLSSSPQDSRFFSFHPMNLLCLLLENNTGNLTSGQNINPHQQDPTATNSSILSFISIVTLITRDSKHKQPKELTKELHAENLIWKIQHSQDRKRVNFCLGLPK